MEKGEGEGGGEGRKKIRKEVKGKWKKKGKVEANGMRRTKCRRGGGGSRVDAKEKTRKERDEKKRMGREEIRPPHIPGHLITGSLASPLPSLPSLPLLLELRGENHWLSTRTLP